MNILVVDDEKGFTEVISDRLRAEHFDAACASNGAQAIDMLKAAHYDLVILDVMMPRMDGLQVLQAIRDSGDVTPVIFLTAKVEETDRIKGLKTGADDYVTKPFSMAELMERIRAVLRRTSPGSDIKSMKIGKNSIDFAKLKITRSGHSESMSPHEASILRLLASEPGKVFSRDEILDKVWGMESFPSNRTVDNYVVKLRQKLESSGDQPHYILTVYGAGYKLDL